MAEDKERSDDERTRKSRIEWINELDKRCLPPRSARKLAIYRSYEDASTDPLIKERAYADIMPPSTVLEGTFSFLDPFNTLSGQVLAKNVLRVAAIPEIRDGRHTGKVEYKEEIESVIFDGGFINVNTETQYPLYVFLELHPLNRSNKFRDKTKSATAFYRYDVSNLKGKGVELAEADLGLDAEQLVRDWDFKKCIEYASSIPNNKIPTMGRQPGEIKLDLRKFARNNPKPFYSLIRNSDAVCRFVAAEAIDLGFVEFLKDVKAWRFYGEKDTFLEVGKVDVNPADKLVEFIASEKGAQVKEEMEAKINYWE